MRPNIFLTASGLRAAIRGFGAQLRKRNHLDKDSLPQTMNALLQRLEAPDGEGFGKSAAAPLPSTQSATGCTRQPPHNSRPRDDQLRQDRDDVVAPRQLE
jgi:hypothetical protein